MREYETVLIIQPEISDEGVGELRDRTDAVLEKAGAIRLLYDDLGKRRLAYEIENFQKGRYVVLQYLDSGSVVRDVERSFRLDDSVLRFLTVLVEEEVADVAGRRARAAEEERVRAEKAAERAAREAEEAAAEAARQEAEAARAAEAADDDSDDDDSDDDASDGDEEDSE